MSAQSVCRGIHRHLRNNAYGVAAVLIALAGTSYAATRGFVGSGGTIHGCVDEAGKLTLVKPKHKCPKGLSAISWNRTGPQGKRGPRGDRGRRGEQGPPGTVDTTNFYTKSASDERFLLRSDLRLGTHPTSGGTTNVKVLTIPQGRIEADCNMGSITFRWINTDIGGQLVYVDNGGPDATRFTLSQNAAADSGSNPNASPESENVIFHIQTSSGEHYTVFAFGRRIVESNNVVDCDFNAHLIPFQQG